MKYYSQLIDGPNGLLSRGLSESDAQNYGALPRTQRERAGLAHTLNKFLKVRFPGYAVRSRHAAIIGVPGFWQDEAGNQEEAVVVEDIAAIARSAFGAIADPHANGSLFVGGVTAPVGFPANSARSVFGNSTKTVDSNSLSLRKLMILH